MQGMSQLNAELLASEEGLCSVELFMNNIPSDNRELSMECSK
jgi:hypothetical protein